VTGGASGIGLALAETMLSYGAERVVLADVNEANLVRETERLNSAHPGQALGIRCDVTNEVEVKGMIVQAAEFGGGRIDLLFNNAGAGFAGYFDEQTNGDWEKAFALNFYGAVYGIRAVLPVMRAQGGGHIVSIISGIAFSPMAYQTMYSATKAALNALTLALRYELWDENIRLTSATPATVATAIWAAGGKTPPRRAPSRLSSPRGRYSRVWRKTSGWSWPTKPTHPAPGTVSIRTPRKLPMTTCSTLPESAAAASGPCDQRGATKRRISIHKERQLSDPRHCRGSLN